MSIVSEMSSYIPYSEKVWQNDSFQAFGKRKVLRINRSANRLVLIWIWQIMDNSRNFPTIRYAEIHVLGVQ